MDQSCPAGNSTGSCKVFRTVESANAGPVEPFIHPEVSDKEYGIQHIKDKLPIGIALSGGGFRAATCAVGYMRGLHLTTVDSKGSSLISQAQYLSSTSGGSWFNAAFSYKPSDSEQPQLKSFWEEEVQAGQLTKTKLDEKYPLGTFEQAIAAKNACDKLLWEMAQHWQPGVVKEAVHAVADVVKYLAHGRHDDGIERDQDDREADGLKPWTSAVREAFLTPFKLGACQDSTVSADHTTGDIAGRHASKAAKKVLLACSDTDRPYPILTGTVFNPKGEDGYSLYPLEFSPLYFGTAAPFPDSEPALGGGYVEPWGVNAEPGVLHCNTDGCSGDVQLPHKAPHPVSLSQAVSISSGFMASACYDKPAAAQKLASTEELVYWGVLPSETTNGVPEHQTMKFADGGALDNLAIMPLLRRGVKCLIVLMASSTPPDNTWRHFANEKSDVAALFGAAQDQSGIPGVEPGELNSMCQVFGENHLEGELLFRELFEALQKRLRAGQPGFHKQSYKIKENKFFHIPASNEEVEVLWIHNQQWAGWEKELPEDTRKQLQHDRTQHGNPGVHHVTTMKREMLEGEAKQTLPWHGGFLTQRDFYRFPYFTTFSLDYSESAVRLLSQMSTAVIKNDEVQEKIQELVASARRKKENSRDQNVI